MEKKEVYIDIDCVDAINNLDNVLRSRSKRTGRQYTVIIMPHSSDERIYASLNGESIALDFAKNPVGIAEFVMRERGV